MTKKVMPKISFRKVIAKNDIVLIEKLAKEIWNEHYVKIIGQQQVDYMLHKFQSRTAISEQITKNGYEYYLVSYQRKNIGYAAIAPTEKSDTILLSKIYLKKSFRGFGFGKQIIKFVEKLCMKRNIKKIRLTVNKNNVKSIAFYKQVGFKNIGATIKDIGNGFIMDDFIMEKHCKAFVRKQKRICRK